MSNPITAFFKELWRDKDKERLQMMQLTNRELSAAVSRIESSNKELSAAVSRTLLPLSRLKKKKHPPRSKGSTLQEMERVTSRKSEGE